MEGGYMAASRSGGKGLKNTKHPAIAMGKKTLWVQLAASKAVLKINHFFSLRPVQKIVPFFLLIIFFSLGLVTILQKSPTFDEMAHLPAGYYYLKTGNFNLYNNNPPLAKIIAALPLLITQPSLPSQTISNHWKYGFEFQDLNSNDYSTIFTLGRLVILLLGIVLGAFIYICTKNMFDRKAASIALLLFSFSPNMLAHAALVTPDLAITLFVFLTLYFFYRYCLKPSYLYLAATGICFGLALLSKFTGLTLIFLLLMIGPFFLKPRKLAAAFLSIIIAGLLILNIGYLFNGFMVPFGTLVFESDFFKSMPVDLRLPLPADWLKGFDSQMLDNQFSIPSYFFGEIYYDFHQLWFYEFVSFILKTTIPVLIFIAIGLFFLRKQLKDKLLILFLPALFYLVFESVTVHLKIGLRYVLPIYPFLFVIAGYGASKLHGRKLFANVLLGVLVLWHITASLKTFPNYLSYFNEFIGSNSNGYKYLVDSNLDWGQDLPALKTFMTENEIYKIKLSYFGTVAPEIYGINYELIPETDLEKGWYAISATHLSGVYDKHKFGLMTIFQGRADLSQFKYIEPVKVLGNSILIYHIQ